MKKQEVLDLMVGEFGSLCCDVTVADANGGYLVVVTPRAFPSLKLEFSYVDGMTRAEVVAKRTELVRQAFAGVAEERTVAELRNELGVAKDLIAALQSEIRPPDVSPYQNLTQPVAERVSALGSEQQAQQAKTKQKAR